MSTTACQNTHLPRLIRRRNSQSSMNAMTNDHRSQYPPRTNNLLTPIPPIRESLSINATGIKRSLSSRHRLNSNDNIPPSKSSQQIYTFSSPPCELQRKRATSASQRVSSAPDECSPRSRLNQPKSSSASGTMRPRPSDEVNSRSKQFKDQHSRQDEQQKDSLNALLKQQEKSKVPKSVQKRRIILLFHRSSSRQEENALPPSSPSEQKQPTTENQPPPLQPNNETNLSPVQSIDLSDNSIEAEMADSMQLAAILAQIQLGDDSNSNEFLSKQQQQQKISDPRKYEYVVTSPLETATYRLSPRTLKPEEELAARSRFSQYYRSEMRSSANAQIPPLMASVVTENNLTMATSTDTEQIITFKLNAADAAKEQTTSTLNKSTDNELVHLCYDATLKRFYDPNTGRYYELTSE